MIYRTVKPALPLSACIGCFWYSEGFEGTHTLERLLPNGEASIVIDLREQPVRVYDGQNPAHFQTYAPAIFCGARTDCFVIDTCRQERVIGIQFRPGGASPFLGLPASEVSNATYSLDDIWPGEATLLREELLNAVDIASMFRILERMLLSRLQRNQTPHPAIGYAIAKLGQDVCGTRVRDVAESVGLTSRRLTNLFRDQTGLTPKAFHRVRRFQRVLRALRNPSRSLADGNWAALAADCGYYDQPHFIHDFRAFAGMTPGEYIRIATPHLNHVPIG